MAENTPNDKDIQKAKLTLDEYNDSLKGSINLAKELVKQVEKLPESLRFSIPANKNLVKTINEYKDALIATEKLSRKALNGRLKEEEIQKQINTLKEKYQTYVDQNEASFKETGRFLLKEKSLQEEIQRLKLEEKEGIENIKKEYNKLGAVQQTLKDAEKKYYNANNPLEKQRAADKIKAAKEELKEYNLSTTLLEKIQARTEKNLEIKKEEREQVKQIIKNHEAIVKSYEEEIENAEILLENTKEQTLLGKLQSKNIKTFIEGLKEAIALFAPLTAAFDAVKKFAFNISDQVTKLQKGLVLSRDEAYAVRQEFNEIAVASGDVAVNTNRLIEANAQLGKQLGFASKFTGDLNIQFIKLTKQIGLSEEAAGGLAKLSIASGKTLEESKNIALETAQSLSSQYGIQLDQREVLEEVGKISGQTLAMFKGSVPALTQAVAQAKLLGTNLDNAKKQASALLDFETSIENELQAELLTGQQLNLERARTAALTGDITTVMKELNNQNIDFNKFSNMNVIAQDKIAAALGTTSDELSNQLLKQQYLGKSQEEVAALAGDEVAKRLEALNAQDRFNLAMEKAQDLISRLVGGGLGKLVDGMASLAENATILYTVLGAMAGISFVKLVAGLAASAVQAGLLAAGTITASQAITFGLSAVAIAAGVGLLLGAFADAQSQAKDVGDMSYSKGKTLISTKEGGLFAPSLNDDIAVAPGIGDILNNANRSTVVAQDNSEMMNILTNIRDEMRGTRENTGKFADKKLVAAVNIQRFGTAQNMDNTNLA
jgi:F0F1-type ATP synthase assembly protein I